MRTLSFTRFTLCLLIGLNLLTPMALAGDKHPRSHTPHEHGHATLNIALDNNTLVLELNSPAANIIGFEHRPRTAKQQKRLQQALANLKKARQLFILTGQAQCTLKTVEVDAHTLVEAHHATHSQRHHTDSHNDIAAHYVYQCQHPMALQQIDAQLLKQFPDIEHLSVQLLTEQAQKSLTLQQNQTIIRVK